MTHADVQAWLDRYSAAWESYDRDAIASLFAEDATYRYHPYDRDDETVRGREAIVKDWVEPDGNASTRDKPGTYDGVYEPIAVEGQIAVAKGRSRYWTDASRSKLAQVYDNIYLLEFDDEGRCRSFVEYFMKRPDDKLGD